METEHTAEYRKRVRAAGIASLTGWAMDLYDLTIILYVATTIGPQLVPSGNDMLQLSFVYVSFAVTLILRPLGSAVFGGYADRNGRKRAMLYAVLGVGVSTALMGAIPTYAVAGVLAPLLFLILRMAQGVFVGGVVASTHTLGTETVSPEHRGLMSGLVAGGGAGAGAVVASAVYFLVTSLVPDDDFSLYGWRIMFFTGLVTAAFSFFVYRHTEESPLWQGAVQVSGAAAKSSPLAEIFGRANRGRTFVNIAIAAGGATTYYLTVGFFPTFYGKGLGIESSTAAIILVIANIGVIAGGLLGGVLSDRYGRRSVILGIGIPGVVILPTLYLWMSNLGADQVISVAVASTAIAIVMMAASAPILIFLNERFPTSIRATGTGLCWNIGFAIGGVTPAIVTAITPGMDVVTIRLAIGISVAAIVMVLGAFIAGETKHLGLGENAGTTSTTHHTDEQHFHSQIESAHRPRIAPEVQHTEKAT
ncbi:MFS transporter [Gordonia humi]|uniref:MFS family permease n=1 Tax=Gordonia humi TaxID=686429 RepID=A0A840F8B1_9ACTN|nr:MFS transporter [Gordonia humi]MBB4138126.1 MFS family permease [Gordonia humi]